MYALIYDSFDLSKSEKEVISLHRRRESAEKALMKRQRDLGKRVWECYTRIVWVRDQIKAGDYITSDCFETWAPDEKIPESDKVPDGD
ncbi:MAG: hypothetical protein JXA79_01285 [Deltaproteobacteria bacterium]|nr:hypothetical protein [Deltaproteobacteria bacterium]